MNMKAAASLTGSLLARKGAAYPAAYSAPSTAPSTAPADPESSHQPQRAYNDPRVIASAPPPPPAPSTGSPETQDGHLAPAGEGAETGDKATAASPVSLPTDGEEGLSIPQVMDKMGRVRLSVRLDPDRYLRVKMASARTRWSAQDIVIAALDRYLGGAQGGDPKPRGSDAGESDQDGEDNVN